MSASFRAFLAIDLANEHKRLLTAFMDALKLHLKQALKPQPTFRWVKPQSLHLTLQFLGQVQEDEAAKLLCRVREELEGLRTFQMNLGPLEWFPSSYHPSILSLQAAPQPLLAELSRALGRGLADLGYVIENRPFRGHLTLARIEGLHHADPKILTGFSWGDLPRIPVREVILFRSDSSAGGSVYTRLADLTLS